MVSAGVTAPRRPIAPLVAHGSVVARGSVVALAWLTIPALTYLVLRHQTVFTAIGFAAVVPVLAVARPRALTLVLVPMCLFATELPHGREAAVGAVGALVAGTLLQLSSGGAVLRRAHLWMVLLAAALLVSLAYPLIPLPSQLSPLDDLVGLLAGLAVLAATAAVRPHPRDVARCVVLCGTVASLYVLYRGGYANDRLVGLSLNTNYLGALLAVPVATAVGLAWHTRRLRWLAWAVPSLGALLATQSRGALVAFAVGAAAVFGTRRGNPRIPFVIGAAAAAVLLVGGVFSGGGIMGALPFGDRSAAELQFNNGVRQAANRFAVEVAVAHPVRGIGYGMFAPYASGSPGLGIFMNTHNDYLRLAAEAGVATLALFLALLWRGLTGRRSGELAALRAGVAAYAAGLLFANTLSNLTVSVVFWVALGCLLAHPAGTSDPTDRPLIPARTRRGGAHARQPGSRQPR